MPVSITPVLTSTVGYLTDVRDQVMSVLRFALMNPGRISSLWDDDLISCRTTGARYEHSVTQFVAQLQNQFNTLFQRKFTDIQVQCELSADNLYEGKDNGQLAITFDIHINQDGKDEGGILTGDILVDTDTYDMKLNFTRSQDSNTI